LRAGSSWRPTRIERVVRVMESSTMALYVETDVGPAVLKYMGNRQGEIALCCELVGTELACAIGLITPPFAVMEIPELSIPHQPFVQPRAGPAFLSKWVPSVAFSPSVEPRLLKKLRNREAPAKLIVFDTWVRNKDRFSPTNGGAAVENRENLLFAQDGRMTQMVVIDHTHALVETTFDELGTDWVKEEVVYGQFPQFAAFVTPRAVKDALARICSEDKDALNSICDSVPREWGMTGTVSALLAQSLQQRAARMQEWLPKSLFDQGELDV
jgi:hypothetical protein